jgi:hypothetical protein
MGGKPYLAVGNPYPSVQKAANNKIAGAKQIGIYINRSWAMP